MRLVVAMQAAAVASGYSNSIAARPAVAVFDGVFSAESQRALASAAESSGVYVRNRGSVTAPEHAIESLLCALKDTETAEVEYWSRENWAAMEAHRDADEEAASADGLLRTPSRVLLVYGEVAEGLAAPTILWCEPQGSEVLAGDGAAEEGVRSSGRLVLVPAIAGRVLDFDGSLMHAVPWCSAGGGATWMGAATCASQTRTVMVLNCWSDYAPTVDEYEDEDEYEDGDEAWDGTWDQDEDEAAETEVAEAEGSMHKAGGPDADAATASCEPRAAWSRTALQWGADVLGAAATEWTFLLNTFGSDEPLETCVRLGSCSDVGSGQDSFFAIVNEPSRPQWLKTSTPTPPLSVGIPSVEGAREERT